MVIKLKGKLERAIRSAICADWTCPRLFSVVFHDIKLVTTLRRIIMSTNEWYQEIYIFEIFICRLDFFQILAKKAVVSL